MWKARELMAKGEIDYAGFLDLVASSAPSTGYCNTMGTATTMNSLAEALGMPLGTVKTHLFRAKAKLRTLLEEEL